ncbi:ABC transporter ATP-binding protein [Natronomonas sp.]|uniref:ABC transporter ATP-binding protein n=1 Tax=Natronomonas sp. TaxID=2184060 RepID=UPI002FC2A39E
MTDPLLSVEDLRTHIHTDSGLVRAVDGVSFDIDRGETVCLVGESGSGKTITCDTLTGLVETPPAEVAGTVRFDGRDLVPFDGTDFGSIRGNEIGYAFQNARSALDPVYTVGAQIVEAIRLHRDVSKADARERAIDLLETVGISPAESRVDEYPHQFSDGMCQRVALAIALAAEPALLVADEPTSALDVTIQARIIDLIDDLRAGRDLALLLVTHDLRVVAALADRVVVMYAGTVVERGPVEEVFANPAHPYTQALFESFTGDGDLDRESLPRDALPTDGCRFRAECPHAVDACADGFPDFETVDGTEAHRAACVYYGEGFDAETVRTEAVFDADDVAPGSASESVTETAAETVAESATPEEDRHD